MITRDARLLLATAILAAGVPAGVGLWLDARTDALAGRLATATGVPVKLGRVDADLSGAVRLTDVALGDLVTADAVEGAVGMGSLLDGELRADEITVESPHVAIRVDADGDSDLARLVRRLAGRRSHAAAAPGQPRLRRIVVAGGTLTAHVAGIGELAADDVELVPDARGFRVITGPLRMRGTARGLAIELAFARSAADVVLPQLRFERVIAVAGSGSIGVAGRPALVLRDLAAGRRAAGAPLQLRAAVDHDAGAARRLAVDVAPADLAVTVRGDRVPLAALGALVPRGLDLSTTSATGTVTLERRGDALEVHADAALEHVVVDHAVVAPAPVELSAALRGGFVVAPDSIAVAGGGLTLGAIELAANGWVRRGAPLSGQLDVELASAPCAALLASLPEAVRGPVDGLALSGTLGGRARLAVDLAAPPGDGATLATTIAGGCRVDAEPPAADASSLTSATEQQLADGSRVRIGPGEPDWTPLRTLPSHVAGAFVSAEDGRFWDHGGFDLEQIANSLEIDLREHRLARGGSTISQQLVKNAFLNQRRSFDRKLQEAILTWRLEDRLDKRQILERYLNIIELGPRVFGLAAAARYWFDTTPKDLTVRQAAFLAALTSQPTSMTRRVRRAGGLDADSAERVAVVLRAMKREGVIGSEAFDEAKTAPLDFAPAVVAER